MYNFGRRKISSHTFILINSKKKVCQKVVLHKHQHHILCACVCIYFLPYTIPSVLLRWKQINIFILPYKINIFILPYKINILYRIIHNIILNFIIVNMTTSFSFTKQIINVKSNSKVTHYYYTRFWTCFQHLINIKL